MKGLLRIFVALLGLNAGFVFAAPELFESIAAVVDGKPIMRSELMGALYQFQNSPDAGSMTEKEQFQFVLDRLIDDKVLLSRVARDSIQIPDTEVDQRVTMHLQGLADRQQIDMATLEKAIRAQLGMSIAQYRDVLSRQVREQMYIGRIRQMHVGSIKPTKKEVDEFYASYKDSLPRQYNCILVSHLQMRIKPDSMIVDSVKRVAEMLIDSLDLGMNWEILASRHSQDTSAQKGGDLGYFRKGLLDPDYERAASRLNNGEYSENPVKTAMGWHIIRVLGRKEDGIRTAHILLKTIPSVGDSTSVLDRMNSFRTSLTTPELFAEAAKKWSDDKETNFRGGNLGWFERSELDSAYIRSISMLSPGEISEPVLIDDSYHLFRLDDSRQVREYNMTEDYSKIEELAAHYMENQKLASLVKKWREEVYIEVRIKE
ncbi:MAG: peptidylprolyl isomerase [Fibrobacter sp.]|jgi:peptidyl-prolyl cis-trans isomerase SurA|nr:peptidylprolyl isomerase [Fibrobacter sp.]